MINKVNNSLNYFIGSHKKLNYILKVIKRLGDDEFVDNILGRNPDIIEIKHYGSMYSDRIIYYIEIGTKGDGFFAEYRRLLEYLFYADRYGFIPCVKSNANFQYGSINDYFKINLGTIEEIREYTNLVYAGMAHLSYAESLKEQSGYALSNTYIQELARISRTYISLNDSIKQYIGNSQEEIGLKGNILGVHVRGTDFKNNYKGHPVYISAQEYCDKTKDIFGSGKYDKVFLATDDIEALNVFEKTFEDKLIYYKDVKRAGGTVSVAFKKQQLSECEKFSLGKEVVRDMLTLAGCASLIAGKSQVSICSIISNAAWYSKYQDLVILDKGINKIGRRYVY